MIRYSLQCESGHAFESWFASSDAYDKQVKRKLVTCPACGSAKVEEPTMAPRLPRTEQTREMLRAQMPASGPAPSVAEPKAPVAMISPQEQEFRQKLKA